MSLLDFFLISNAIMLGYIVVSLFLLLKYICRVRDCENDIEHLYSTVRKLQGSGVDVLSGLD